jgi:hypothetical protein
MLLRWRVEKDLPAHLGGQGWRWQARLGFTIAERTVARNLRRILRRGDLERKWFSQNDREVIAAMDFFTVPTVTFRVLYGFFVIEHERRKILHCYVTPHPTAEWIVQPSQEAFPAPAPAESTRAG